MKRNRRDRIGRASGIGGVLIGCLVAAGCTSAPDPATQASPPPASSSAPSASSSASPPDTQSLVVDVTISAGQVNPSGRKIDARVGQPVVLNVTSDADDEIHAHTGGDGYELEVKAGEPATGTFTLTSAGSFEVESHHLEKVIVILNAR